MTTRVVTRITLANMSDDRRTTRQPVMDALCAGGCGADITEADNFDRTEVHLKPGWLITENSREYLRVRCPRCGGEN
jgi:hypothetical protein